MKRLKNSESVAETLASLIEKATISQEAVPEEAPPAEKTVVAPSRELKHKVPQTAPSVKFEQFSSHPWAPFFEPRVQIQECEYYHSDLDVRNYEKVTAAGYSGLHLHPSGEPLPTVGHEVPILEAVGPRAIENFRRFNSYDNIISIKRSEGELPTMPLVDQASLQEQHTYVRG